MKLLYSLKSPIVEGLLFIGALYILIPSSCAPSGTYAPDSAPRVVILENQKVVDLHIVDVYDKLAIVTRPMDSVDDTLTYRVSVVSLRGDSVEVFRVIEKRVRR